MDKIILVPIIITILVIGVIGWALLSEDTESTVSSEDISIKSGSDISEEPQEEITEESIIEEDVEEESLEEESEDDINEDEGAELEETDEESSEDESFEEEDSEDEKYTEESESAEESEDEEINGEEGSDEEYLDNEEDMITGDVVKAQSKKPTKTLKKIVEPLLEIEYNVPERYQRLLPLTAKITSGKQIIYLEGTAEGVKIVDKIEEPDIEIRGTLKDLEKLSKIKNINSLKKAFEETKVQVKSNTFKGATVITAIEEITETKLVERSFIQKIIGTGISAATGKFSLEITSITGNFVLNNLN